MAIALSIAILGTGCGTSGRTATATGTVPTGNYGQQFLADGAPVRSATLRFVECGQGSGVPSHPVADRFAQTLKAFGESLRRQSWPTTAAGDVRRLATTSTNEASVLDRLGTASDLLRVDELERDATSEADKVRVDLHLPPVWGPQDQPPKISLTCPPD